MTYLLPCFALIAFLYASVGHGGASGYLAVMALLGYAPEQARPDALLLNLAVSAMAFWQYRQGGYFVWRDFLWLAAFSVPMALLGGMTPLTDDVYHLLLGVVLLLAAVSVAFRPAEAGNIRSLPAWLAAVLGAGIGLVSGLTGIGGGVILSPVLLLAGYARQKQAAAISAAFIFVNSLSGFAGWLQQGKSLDPNLPWMLLLATSAGLAGAWLGARRYTPSTLKWVLAAVLLVAAGRLLVG